MVKKKKLANVNSSMQGAGISLPLQTMIAGDTHAYMFACLHTPRIVCTANSSRKLCVEGLRRGNEFTIW